MIMAGVVLVALGVLARLFSLGVYRRVSQSGSREVIPSPLPGTPWLHVQSDRNAVKVIVGEGHRDRNVHLSAGRDRPRDGRAAYEGAQLIGGSSPRKR